ncbi:hypothetical protein [Sporosarcina pasteurii]|uniref:DUF3169 domain-containing protein n=1 Tax=Sporosarcina pasteurii TaxID=1474 RepID=A0A380C4M6_SPOPA|nr:hypothetical protein [Sporosarcina pasteurii]MDS9471690.1 hypothetical protein [Sporosarcina pasteurii]QBQ04709.1 hypothetical protein E2C16_03000 [Sporosarcina pasteurii]SUJ12046.1 Uncharacterised protein [Sporosarcina pasteurii]
MKNDMRVTMPLWQMGAIFLLIIITIVTGLATKVTNITSTGFEFEMTFENYVAGIFLIAMFAFVIFLTLFIINIRKHNKRFPDKKIKAFTLKPQEYIEDDELFEEMTKRATKKVYSYYAWTLPLLVGFSLVGFLGRTVILVGILLIAMGQYWIYYSTMRKMLKSAEEEV